MRVLIVEDETLLATLVQQALAEDGIAADIAGSAEEGNDWLAVAGYDAIVLDVLLPGADGITFCRSLRQRGDVTPVLMLTARDTIDDRVTGLDAGADDYLVKPFAMVELLARLRALSRRTAPAPGAMLQAGDLWLDPATRQVTREGVSIELPNKQYRVLEYLIRNADQVVTRTMIADHVWGYDFPSMTNVIDVHIRAIRKAIGDPYPGKRIQTVRGAGYRLSSEP